MTAAVEDYLALVTGEHQGKPKFTAALTALVRGFVDAQNVIESMPAIFDVDAAVGAQLDVVGRWVGLSRALAVPIPNVFFSFNSPGLGFNQGIWFNSGDPTEGLTQLDDDTYRLMIKAKIAANIWDGSVGDANARLAALFPGGSVELQDNMDMSQALQISGDTPSTLFSELVQQGYIQLRPASVQLT